MNRAGVLLDTGPLVALLSKNDGQHAAAQRAFAACRAPLRCCEAVIAEACFLLTRVHPDAPAEAVAIGRKGVYDIGFTLKENWIAVERLLRKYADRPISLADASLIRCAEIYQESRILTFDADFAVYRWGRHRRFEIVAP